MESLRGARLLVTSPGAFRAERPDYLEAVSVTSERTRTYIRPHTCPGTDGGFSMTGKSQPGRVIIRSSHEDLSDPTAHLLMPTAEQGPFPAFDRFAGSVATSRMQAGLHAYVSEVFVDYVVDGCYHHVGG